MVVLVAWVRHETAENEDDPADVRTYGAIDPNIGTNDVSIASLHCKKRRSDLLLSRTLGFAVVPGLSLSVVKVGKQIVYRFPS